MTESFAVLLDPLAWQDVADAAAWYEQQHPGLGAQFSLAFDAVVERVAARPLASPPLRSLPRVRRTSLDKFPYHVVYRVDSQACAVEVVACLHQRRDPASLVRRLQGSP
jgi:plasmid stabilization system protein ParE